MDKQYVLIVGCPRSGTTLLASMVGRHTEVGILNEDVTGKWMGKILSKRVAANKLCVPNQIQLRKRSVFALRWFKKLGWIEESPRSALSIEQYLTFPTLRILAVIRDGNDVISSMMTRGKSSLRIASHRWVKATEAIYELHARYRDRILVIPFERLVLEPEVYLRHICDFLQLPFQREMLDGYQYNPKYPESKLNEEKVDRHLKENFDFQLPERFPSTYRKYRALLSEATSIALRPTSLVIAVWNWARDIDLSQLWPLFG